MDRESAINYLVKKGFTRDEAEKKVKEMAGGRFIM